MNLKKEKATRKHFHGFKTCLIQFISFKNIMFSYHSSEISQNVTVIVPTKAMQFGTVNFFFLKCRFTGLSDIPGEAMVKLYCPKCMDVYTPKSSRHHHTDGAYFGTGFPHMLFMVHPEYRPKRPANQFVPRFASQSRLAVWCSSQVKLNYTIHIFPGSLLT